MAPIHKSNNLITDVYGKNILKVVGAEYLFLSVATLIFIESDK
ncbi:MAG: hypothetical protein AB8B53_14215 [Flavobacteriales bacterium]